MIRIQLTKNKVTVVDDDFAHLSDYKWFAHRDVSGNWYALRNFQKEDGTRGTLRLHHCIMGQPLHGKEIDHIDGNGLNNKRENLRYVTRRENTWNRRDLRNGTKTSQFVGVSRCSDCNRWQMRCRISSGKRIGKLFKTEKEAAVAYTLILNSHGIS